ncbi:type I-C CRISPR-associated endonuclease Cas1c [Candidatus Spyradosoma sp. SGI.093]|uniref:type I-C CRISPR-associated endonuclease Cas1c n=1 Tax=Candidatus Spyradosoma sp. SGI.093 TaxID=3420583 RepID=UPI003CFE097C
MKILQNTLYVTKENAYVRLDGESADVRLDGKSLGRFPLINLAGIVTLGWDIACSPALMGACAERGIAVSFLNPHGKFLAAVHGYPNGNVLLRRRQHRAADDPAAALDIARRCIQAKFSNTRTLLRRAAREAKDADAAAALSLCADIHRNRISETLRAATTDELRGIEGDTAAHYFRGFNALIVSPDEKMRLAGRSRRPPRDPVNAVLSFLYTLLAHDCRSACAAAGLDPQIGFLHADRPGRPGLALDLMEEFRPVLADRVALSLINRRQLSSRDFRFFENGSVLLSDDARRTLLQVWQERKREEITHPTLGEKMPLGLVPLMQARLLARHLRGDFAHYLPFLWK